MGTGNEATSCIVYNYLSNGIGTGNEAEPMFVYMQVVSVCHIHVCLLVKYRSILCEKG